MSDHTSFKNVSDILGDFNSHTAHIKAVLANISTATLVKVVAVTNTGEVVPVGFVDVQPLVNQVDGAGLPIPHSIIYNSPYIRIQGGGDAIILDPKVGDIGIMVFADRDITGVMTTKSQSNPSSNRKFSKADGLYIGGLLNGTPTQYIQFSAAGIRIHSPVLIKIDAPDVQINAPTVEIVASTSVTMTTPTFNLNGNQVTSGTQTAAEVIFSGIHATTHKHGGITAGGGVTAGPQ